jgi:hypothetical protein
LSQAHTEQASANYIERPTANSTNTKKSPTTRVTSTAPRLRNNVEWEWVCMKAVFYQKEKYPPSKEAHELKTGKFHDQADARWIEIRGQLRGHNDTPFGRSTPSRPMAARGLAALRAYLVV